MQHYWIYIKRHVTTRLSEYFIWEEHVLADAHPFAYVHALDKNHTDDKRFFNTALINYKEIDRGDYTLFLTINDGPEKVIYKTDTI